ncbi:MAG: T-complex protein 1 subunit eta [Amphiamblys sp. WSBS2006]|nr:MAG: T-complex protein 1 subunit eta [Amphiamblys sp. WSBS2006]
MQVAPQIILLREGADVSQGRAQILANIDACLEVVGTVKTTLGPRGRDKLFVDDRGAMTISNDGATIMARLEVEHPCAKLLVDISKAQDAETGDGTTTVVVLSGELLKELGELLRSGASPNMLIGGLQEVAPVVLGEIEAIETQTRKAIDREKDTFLLRCAETALNSKLVYSQKEFFARMVVDAVSFLGPKLSEKMVGVKHVSGGVLQDTQLVHGVAFKKTFSYAGFEQQPKRIEAPKILCLKTELELKSEYENAEVRVETVADYQNIVDAEWEMIFGRLRKIEDSGANVVLSSLPVGDLATQYFADRNIFCAGRVPEGDIQRVLAAAGGSVQTTVSGLGQEHLGHAGLFEEREIGSERYNFLTECKESKTATVILRGGSSQFIDEVERSLHDAITIVRRVLTTKAVVPGAGATEMRISRALAEKAKTIAGKTQAVFYAASRAFEAIPRQIAENAALDSVLALAALRKKHAEKGDTFGIDIASETPLDALEKSIIEPALVKRTAALAALETAAAILSIDYTIKAESKRRPEDGPLPGMAP